MRTVKLEASADEARVAIVDWKASAMTVLESIDSQLADFGLEVVMVETASDDFSWTIEKQRI